MSPQRDDHSAPRNPSFLQRQLERARFERALEVAQSMVEKGAFLTTAELADFNEALETIRDSLNTFRDSVYEELTEYYVDIYEAADIRKAAEELTSQL